jgi:hypothetical protein
MPHSNFKGGQPGYNRWGNSARCHSSDGHPDHKCPKRFETKYDKCRSSGEIHAGDQSKGSWCPKTKRNWEVGDKKDHTKERRWK